MRRIVVKVGTALLADEKRAISRKVINNIASGISQLRKNGFAVVVVSSGAVGCGMLKMGAVKPADISQAQMLSSIGQPILMDVWMKALEKRGLIASQILCSADDFRNRGKFLNLRRTIFRILNAGVVPVINENDSVAVEEIRFGDNDRLSALVASHIEADDIVLLTNVEGFFVDGKLVSEIRVIDKVLLEKAGAAGHFGTGGMRSKLIAAKITQVSGCRMRIASGREKDVLQKIFLEKKAVGTVILPLKKINQRKRWICFGSVCRAEISVDAGAQRAILKGGKSLLAAGITDVCGECRRGETVVITCDRKAFARGIVNYSSAEIRKIAGENSSRIKEILGYIESEEVIGRDNLVIEV